MIDESAWDLVRLRRDSFVRGIEYHDVLGSTNDRAIELIAGESVDTPFLVLADKQTAGRGRGSNAWWSADGALTFSVIIDVVAHGLAAERWPLVSLATGLAVCDALMETVPAASPKLKWPNDVFLNDRKMSGLLVEVPGARTGQMVIGIGINVNNSLSMAPEELTRTATSLIDAAGMRHDRTELLLKVLEHLDTSLAMLAVDGRRLVERWRTFSLLTGRTVLLRVGAEEVLGDCHGVDDEGGLLLQTPSGMRRFSSGVVVRFD